MSDVSLNRIASYQHAVVVFGRAGVAAAGADVMGRIAAATLVCVVRPAAVKYEAVMEAATPSFQFDRPLFRKLALQ